MGMPAEPLSGMCRHYTDALLAGDARGATAIVEDAARDGAAVEDLYLRVLQPALAEVGDRWERGEVSVAQEQFATAATSSVLASLADGLTRAAAPAHGRALVCGTPGERHALGGRMVADFLAAAGWDVTSHAGEPTVEAIVERAARERVALVALSTALPWLLPEARRLCVALHALAPAPLVLVGGRAYHGDAYVADLVGADGYAPDPRALLELLDRRAV
jgi:MerR family transcriptional regulator, light-induced transcriptional regulator